ncbi:MAG: DsrE/DsrF/DrsH-like family protein [Candidatus Thermoplasmatota archaeon]|nr:DsrE/DsrF/DrsH-like family protein [Candidatus Thermoplasmatota archaeon]
MPEETIPDEIRKEYEKTMQRAITKKIGSMTIIITEDTYDKALTAFNFGVAGVELGVKVSIFFTSRGVNIIKKSYKPRRARWGEAPVAWKESSIKRRGGIVLAELMYQARDMGVHFYACYTSMISSGIKEAMLLENIKVIRMAEFLGLALESDIHLVIS